MSPLVEDANCDLESNSSKKFRVDVVENFEISSHKINKKLFHTLQTFRLSSTFLSFTSKALASSYGKMNREQIK